MSRELHVLCAGAARGLLDALRPGFESRAGASLHTRFGAVGALTEALAEGARCDVLIATDAAVRSLQASGAVAAGRSAALGRVRTGIAVRRGDPLPDVGSAASLAAALLAAPAVFFPDPSRATAGIHFASVLAKLGIDAQIAPRLRTYPNGATAMRELAACGEPGAIGCTQITEINDTTGVRLVGPLPRGFELATLYVAATVAQAAEPALAERLVELLGGAGTQALRTERGFELEVPRSAGEGPA